MGHTPAITDTGVFTPDLFISNADLVAAFNAYDEAIAVGKCKTIKAIMRNAKRHKLQNTTGQGPVEHTAVADIKDRENRTCRSMNLYAVDYLNLDTTSATMRSRTLGTTFTLKSPV
ncbi:MAG: hypothetical protein GDA35_08275 [Hyphomonadaceae bacterium]|nr:hypothetical protein [Hyphomonadaceae bacterium]